MWKEGDRVSGGGWRTRWLIRVPCMLAPKYALLRQSIASYVALPYQSPRPAGYHPPQAVPPLSKKEGFVVHYPLPSLHAINPRARTTPSLLPCGRRGTAPAVEDRELAGSLEYLAYSLPNMHCTASANGANSLLPCGRRGTARAVEDRELASS